MSTRRTLADLVVGSVVSVLLLAAAGALLGVFLGALAAVAHLVYGWVA